MSTPVEIINHWEECRRACVKEALERDFDKNLAKANVYVKCIDDLKQATPPGTWWL